MNLPIRSPRPNSSAGFSMVEFLFVAVILGVGLLGLAALSAVAIRGFGGSRTRDAAANLADSVLDRLALDGRLSATLRLSSSAIPASALLANATDDNSNSYADPATGDTAFDLQGQPTTTTPVYTVTWVRRAPKSALVPVSTSLTTGSEVVVNVQWNDAVKNDTTGVVTTKAHYISVSRYMRY
ncbi:MAG TPA: prepilin-type N-terminal cleavage/methylation domain-containing protein [Holophagaceae bacterium]|nr:prepilin-type N-terminal cleavage/methylation domain-containing protein [Holophagaceae bacterium]